MLKANIVYCMEAIDFLKQIDDNSVDMILCDLPYGITSRNKWDAIIPRDFLWREYKRIVKENGAIVLTAVEPFASMMVMSNPDMYKYSWIWRKSRPVGFLNAKKQPLRDYENVLVFYNKQPTYNPQGLTDCEKINKRTTTGSNYRAGGLTNIQTKTGYPRQVLDFPSESNTEHPTQKPVALFEYLIKTYTNEGDLVLDNCMGSGTTAIACKKTGRNFIGCDIEEKYVDIANKRLKECL